MVDNVEYDQSYNFNYQGDFLNPLYCSAAHENKGKQTLRSIMMNEKTYVKSSSKAGTFFYSKRI